MRNAKLVVLTLVSVFTALGCSVRMNARPEYAGAYAQPQEAETFATPYKNSWDSNANELAPSRVRPVSVGAAAEAVQNPVASPGKVIKRPITQKQVVEQRFGLR
ncbi:MAG: hypothetical protein U0414_01740 [Polyangiaceae bacterium]